MLHAGVFGFVNGCSEKCDQLAVFRLLHSTLDHFDGLRAILPFSSYVAMMDGDCIPCSWSHVLLAAWG